jgi:hypothetical protein
MLIFQTINVYGICVSIKVPLAFSKSGAKEELKEEKVS